MFKFGSLEGSDEVEEHYDNVFQVEKHPEWSRVAIGAKDGQIALMLDIARSWRGPFGVLYVLAVSRAGHDEGRYQSAETCDYETLRLFAWTFREYFEQDGRHHLWIADVSSRAQLVYDNHDIIYAYGEVERVASVLKDRGFREEQVRIPVPHSHHYNREFDASENEIMEYWEWKRFPLEEADGG